MERKRKQKAVFDIEVYPNFFVMMVMPLERKMSMHIRRYYFGNKKDRQAIGDVIRRLELIGFNCNNYDIPIAHMVSTLHLADNSCSRIKAFSDRIINGEIKPWQHDIPWEQIDTIDLFDVAPGVQTSLKLYAGRMHVRDLQDLPYPPDTMLTPAQKFEVEKYCEKDLQATASLYYELEDQIELRRRMSRQYQTNLMSKSDAQIAEAVFRHELPTAHKPEIHKSTTWEYDPPEWLTDPELLSIVEGVKFQLSDKMAVQMPKALADKTLTIGLTTYKLGIGGLHSTEKCARHEAVGDLIISDFDVASYYPSIILNQQLYPRHLGKDFIDVYRRIVDRRLEAKKSGDKVTADSLKITINGSYGKFGSKYSFLFAPKLVTQVTLTGQLALLLLIKNLEKEGYRVVSANTDGIVVVYDKKHAASVLLIVKRWEQLTGFTMEETRYDALYSRDVNNYLAIKGNEVKGKGIFTESGLTKNPANAICYHAIKENALHNIPIAKTIRGCKDLTQFLTVRTVRGGAVKDGEYLGRVVRWYYAKNHEGVIEYKTSGNKVPRSEGGKPVMKLPVRFPRDVDHDWYINETIEIMMSCAYLQENW